MKTSILLFAVIFGYVIPTYSQVNRHRKIEPTIDPFQNNKIYSFDSYKFDKFDGLLSGSTQGNFKMFPIRPVPNQFTDEIHSNHKMPCFHLKSGDRMPCFKPADTFPMRVFKPKNVAWGILW